MGCCRSMLVVIDGRGRPEGGRLPAVGRIRPDWTDATRTAPVADVSGRRRPVVDRAVKEDRVRHVLRTVRVAADALMPRQRLIVAHVAVRTLAMHGLVG